MLTVCSTGLGTLAVLPRFGGGAAAPVAAIPVMLGAGASGAAAAACRVGAVPPLTTSGDAADFADPVFAGLFLSEPVLSESVLSGPVLSEAVLSAPEVFPAVDRADPEGLVEAAAASGESSSSFGLVA